jgi:hypothetical protein
MRELVDLTKLADMFDLTRREANEMACDKDFPAPAEVLHGDRIWYDDVVRDWARQSGKLI